MKQKVKKHNYIWISVAAVIILAGLTFWLWHSHKSAKPAASFNSSSTASKPSINYGPPTQTEKQDSQNAKSRDLQQSSSATTPPPAGGQKQAEIQIVSATTSSVKANVIGVFENGGTCTAKFTKGTEVHTFTSAGIQSSNYTQCASITVSGITGSGWTVVVSYSSPTATGQSAPITIN